MSEGLTRGTEVSSFQRVGLDWVLLYTEVLMSEGLTRGTEVPSFQRVGLEGLRCPHFRGLD